MREGIAPNKASAKFCYYPYVMKDDGITIAIQPVECRDGGDVCLLEEDDDDDEPVELPAGNFPTEADDELFYADMVPVQLPGDEERHFKKKGKSARPNVRVEIGALPLIVAGSADNIMPDVEQRLADMGLIVMKNRLARVDACVDIPASIKSLQHACVDRHYRTRARSVSTYYNVDDWAKESVLMACFDDTPTSQTHCRGEKETGFSIGKDKVMCRGYDKLEKERHCEEMLEALRLRRFGGGELSEQLMRIEFQLRREALRGITVLGVKDGIETWQDWCRYKAAIVSYLCNQWLIFTKSDFNRNHSERLNASDYHPDWAVAAEAFKRAFGESEHKISRIQKSIKREAVSALAQAIGNDQSAMIKVGIDLSPHDPNWIDVVAAFRYKATQQFFTDPDKQRSFWENWRNKLLMQEASIPDEALADLIPAESIGVFDVLGSVASTGLDVIQTQALPAADFEPPTAHGGGARAYGPAPDASA